MEIHREYGNRAPGNRRVLVSRGLYSCTIPNIANLATDGNQCHKCSFSAYLNFPQHSSPHPTKKGNLVLYQTHWNWCPLHISGFIDSAESISHKKEFRDRNNKCLGVARSSAMKWNLHEARPMQIVHGQLPREILTYARMDIRQLLSKRKNE
jgi:hypothetical protein